MRRPQWTIPAAALAVTLLLAACGGSTPSTPSTTGAAKATTTASPKPAATASAKPAATTSSKAASPTTAATGSTLTVATISTGTNKIPAYTTTGEDQQIFGQIYDSLLEVKPGTTQLGPGLATSYSVSKDGKTWTLHLRKGVKWQGGYGTFTCNDVKFTWDFNKNPANKSLWQSTAASVAAVDCPDPNTAVFHLAQPNLGFDWDLANSQPSTGYVLSAAAWQKLGKAGYEKTPIGTGPFELTKLVPGQEAVLTANPDYWGPKPGVHQVVFKVIADTQTAALAVKTGAVDIARIDPITAAQYANVAGTRLLTKKALHTDYLEINKLVKPFSDVRVRQAMRDAIDYPGLIKTVLRGYGTPGYCGLIAPQQIGFDPSVNHQNTYDLAAAKKLLSQAGITSPVKGFFVTYNDTLDSDVAQYVAANFTAAGLNLQGRPLERGTLDQVRVAATTPGAVIGDSWEPDPSEIFEGTFLGNSIPPKGIDIARYTGIDQLFTEETTTASQAARLKALSGIQSRICTDVPAIDFYLNSDVWLLNAKVQGYQPTVLLSGDPLQLVTLK